MLISCPNCSARFNLPDQAYAPGRKARCSQCATVFPLPDLRDAAPAAPFALKAPDPEPPRVPEPQEGAFAQSADGPLSIKAPAKKKSAKTFAVALAVLLCLAGLGYGGYAVFFAGAPATQPGREQPLGDAALEKVRNIKLDGVRQYFIANEKLGRIAVVEGRVINNFATPKEFIKLEISLYNDKGEVLASQQQLCGATVSTFQLQISGKDELQKALNNKLEILTNNTNVKSGGEVPFMAVFLNPPADANELGVKVIDAQDPQPR